MAEDGESGFVFTDDVATFGDRLTHAREAAGLSVEGLARRLGVRRPLVAAWEADQSEPRANQMQMMSGLLGVSLRWLMTGTGGWAEAPPAATRLAMGELSQLRAELLALAGRMGELERRLKADLGAGQA